MPFCFCSCTSRRAANAGFSGRRNSVSCWRARKNQHQADQPFCFANGLAGAIYFYQRLADVTEGDDEVPDFPLLHVRPDDSENYVAEQRRKRAKRAAKKNSAHGTKIKQRTTKKKGEH